MRSMWKGAISFGLVMIPVKLYAATEQKDITFRQVHREDGGRIRFRRVCSIDGEEVPYEDVAKGYELPTGEMVILTDDDMAELPLPSTRSIEVLHFMPADQLDPILLNRSYYAEPDPAGERAYVLLRDSLDRSGKVALAKVALRQRETLATLRVRDGVLVLETLLWPDEVREAAFPFLDDDIEARPQELRMAASLIDSMTVDFDPSEYHDDYREALQELVDAKVEGRELAQPVAAASEPETTSLADALKASLAAARQAPAQSAGTIRAAKPRASLTQGGGSDGESRTRRRTRRAGDDESAAEDADAAASSSGRSGSRSRSPAKTSPAKASPAKTSPAKASPAKASTEDGTAEDGTAKTGTGRSSGAKTGTARSGTAKAGSGKSGTPDARQQRTRRKAG
jgi:DNA end-binding protein Ku